MTSILINPLYDHESYPIMNRVKGIFNDITGETLPTIATLPVANGKHWRPPTIKVNETIKRNVKAGCPPSVAAAAYHEFMASRPWCTVIHTDGSKTDTVGYGILVEPADISINGALAGQCSIFSAEAYALVKAAQLVNCKVDAYPAVIFSDSASCLEAVQGSIKHPWIAELRTLLDGKDITLCWIPGHTGIPGNEKADDLANAGRLLPISNETVPAPDAHKWCLEAVQLAWQREWHSSQSKLRRVKDSVLAWRDNDVPEHQRILTRLRIGHTHITHRSYFSNHGRAPPTCTTCGTHLNVEHLLLECRAFEDVREEIRLGPTMAVILNNRKKNETKIIQYIKKCKLFNEI